MTAILSSSGVSRIYQWTAWKAVWTVKGGPYQYDFDGYMYTIWFYDGPEINICNIWDGCVPDNVINNGYSQSQNDADLEDFQANYLSNANQPIQLKAPDGRPRVVNEKSNITSFNFYSHDWTNPTTWYSDSIISYNEILSNSNSDGYTYQTAYKNIIDTYHGRLTQEDFLTDNDGYSFRVSIWVDGYIKTEQDPHYGTGGDYVINYGGGYIIFNYDIDPSSVVTATYHYATDSTFVIFPLPGTQIRMPQVEVQFSEDIIITDSIYFQPYGYVQYFAPQYCTDSGGPYPPNTKIPLGNPMVYKGIQDYLGDAKKSYPNHTPIGGSGWRGMTKSAIIMNWDYDAEKVLRSDMGMEIRIFLQHNLPFGGSFATATFYCISENLT